MHLQIIKRDDTKMKTLISWFGSWSMLAKHFLFLSLGTLVLLGGLGFINLREAEGLGEGELATVSAHVRSVAIFLACPA